MTDATQQSDLLTLEECLAAMRRIGAAPEDYVVGYRAGYLNLPFDETGGHAYRRGFVQGAEARWRGAHGAYVPEWARRDGGAA